MENFNLEIGHVLWLIVRFSNNGDISDMRHPYLVVDINEDFNYVEVAQLDSLAGKEYKATFKSNHVIFCDKPSESVISKDSYIQLDRTFRIELFSSLSKYRLSKGKLSEPKREKAIKAYFDYHENHIISEMKNVYMSKEEILYLNRSITSL